MAVFQNYVFDPVTRRGSIDIYHADLAIVNGLRRTIQTDLPYVAFQAEPFDKSTITIQKNMGPLNNEFLAHRMSLLPVHLPLETIATYKDGDLVFELDVNNQSHEMVNVTTDDLKVTLQGKEVPVSDVFPHDPITGQGVVITRLRKGDAIQATGYAIMGTTRTHAGFSPISLCTYRFLETPEAADMKDPIERERTFLKNKKGDPEAFQFSIESECGHSFYEIMLYGIDTLVQRVEKSAPVQSKMSEGGDYCEYTFENEDDTLGNLFQSLLFDRYVREKNPFNGKEVLYVGYVCPHPLERRMLMRVTIENGTQKDYEDFMEESKKLVLKELESFMGGLQKTDPTAKVPPRRAEPVVAETPVPVVNDEPEHKEEHKIEQPEDDKKDVPPKPKEQPKPKQEVKKEEPKPEEKPAPVVEATEEIAKMWEGKFVITKEQLAEVKTSSSLNMRLAERIALVIKDYKEKRMPTAVVKPAECGILAFAMSKRFTKVVAVDRDTAAVAHNKDVLKSNIEVANSLPEKPFDLLLANGLPAGVDAVNVREFARDALAGTKPAYLVIVLPKKTNEDKVQAAMLEDGWQMEHKERVLKEVLLMVFKQA